MKPAKHTDLLINVIQELEDSDFVKKPCRLKSFEEYFTEAYYKIELYEGEMGLTAIIHDYEHSKSEVSSFLSNKDNIEVFCFYIKEPDPFFMKLFCNSCFSEQMKVLRVGGCDKLSFEKDIDYSKIISILGEYVFPNLRICELGVWDLYSNSGECHGWLGDISPLLHHNPHIEELNLFGYFVCSKVFKFSDLNSISLYLSYWGEAHQFLQEDLDNILESSFPKLRHLVIYTEAEDTIYSLSENIYKIKSLEVIELSGAFVQSDLSKIKSVFADRECQVLLY